MKFAIHIATKNRKDDLLFTLEQVYPLLENPEVTCVVFDDGSDDGTADAVKQQFPKIQLLQNTTSRGYLYCRNVMLNETQADVAISLDDDAHFLSENPLETIGKFFNENPKCGLIAFRIYWSKTPPENPKSTEVSAAVKSFVGCGHAWRMSAWRSIPSYPEWFEFYGEETFASMHLFKNYWEVQYVPEVFVLHRVDLKLRKNQTKDFTLRYRRGLRAGWFAIFLFYPPGKAIHFFLYSLWMQLKTKIFKGQFKVVMPILGALWDLLVLSPNILKNRAAFTAKEFADYAKLKEPKIYWKPEK
ncbi:MAG: glycosyltransferase family 2 protein [Flavobacterium sp.]|uniref:glycosyltransferase family 2 protein n=1 Tax=Flavobacterium sp. TaxID=239 RepID=UPI00391D94DE